MKRPSRRDWLYSAKAFTAAMLALCSRWCPGSTTW